MTSKGANRRISVPKAQRKEEVPERTTARQLKEVSCLDVPQPSWTDTHHASHCCDSKVQVTSKGEQLALGHTALVAKRV